MKFPYNRILEIKSQYQEHSITYDEAKELLAFVLDLKDSNDCCEEALGEHQSNWRQNYRSYGPLLRLSDVCNTLRMWAQAYINAKSEGKDEWWLKERADIAAASQKIDISISKSNLLARLFFTDEGLRRKECPVHKGKWSGCHWDKPCECQAGSNVTGWLAEDPKHADITYWDEENKRYKTRDEANPESPKIA